MNASPRPYVVAARFFPHVLIVTAALLAAPRVNARPTVTVGVDRVVVTGITPGGEAILFGRSIAYQGGVPVLARHAASGKDDDSDGTVMWLFDEVEQRSIWVAVDLDTGDHAIGSPDGATPRVITVTPNDWRENDDSLDIRREYVDFLLVRPRKGAWALAVRQGSSRDADGRTDNNLRLRTPSMFPLHGKESPPPYAAKKDVLVIIDLFSLDVAVVSAE